MFRVICKQSINATREVVYDAITNIPNLPNTNPDIVKVEFISDQRSGAGTRFRETRKMGKRELVSELEIVEMTPPHTARFVTDTNGVVWDTLFTVEMIEGKPQLTIAMDAKPHRLGPKLMMPLMKPLFKKGIQKHLSSFKLYCENNSE